jgi:hypothetical protein
MKSIDFIKVLRKVIREEVRTVVKEELQAYKPLLKETTKQVTTKPIAQKAQPKVKPMPDLGVKGPLADVLKETYAAMQQTPTSIMEGYEDIDTTNDWPDMNGGTFTSEHAPAMAPTRPQPTQRFNPDPMAGLMKDYSAVMKAADQHAQGYRP